jgi:hypothetical protein
MSCFDGLHLVLLLTLLTGAALPTPAPRAGQR